MGGGGVLPIMAYGEGSSKFGTPNFGTFFMVQVHERVGISQIEVFKRVGKLSFQSLEGPRSAKRYILWL